MMSGIRTIDEIRSELPDDANILIDNDLSSQLLNSPAFEEAGTSMTVREQFKFPINRQKSMQQQFVEEIDFKEIQTEEVVGKGSFGVVYKAKWRGRDVAVKHINTEGERRAFTIEILQLSRVSHPNIVRLYGACTTDPVCLVMEYAEGGSLYNVLHCEPKPHYNAGHAISWALQCAKGVAYLHNMKPKPLVHRDLKPPNLLLILGGRTLKICDFGTACDLNTYMTNNKGSAAWMAPEVFEGSKYTEKCDIFSWGIILWEVLSRRKPFDDIGGSAYRIMWAVHVGQRPPLIEGCPKPIEDLITRCWLKNPEERPAMEDIVQIMSHLAEFFSGELEPIEYDPTTQGEKANEDDTMDTTHNNSNQFIKGSVSYDDAEVNKFRTLDSLSNDSLKKDKIYNLPFQHSSQLSCNREVETKSFVTPMTPNVFGSWSAMHNSHNFQPLRIDCDPSAWNVNTSLDTSRKVQNMLKFNRKDPETNKKTAQLESQCTTNTSDLNDLEEVYRVLDADLRPLTPDDTDPRSKEIFEEHKLLAQEYLKVQTDVALLGQCKRETLQKMSEKEATDKLEIQKLTDEKESLMKLYRNLKRQLEIMQRPESAITATTSAVSIPGEDGWVLVPRQEPSKIS